MEIHFKKLTHDLLEVCRMLDDKPEAKNKLSDIAVDVSFLPDVGYAYDKGKTEPPNALLPAQRMVEITHPFWTTSLMGCNINGSGPSQNQKYQKVNKVSNL